MLAWILRISMFSIRHCSKLKFLLLRLSSYEFSLALLRCRRVSNVVKHDEFMQEVTTVIQSMVLMFTKYYTLVIFFHKCLQSPYFSQTLLEQLPWDIVKSWNNEKDSFCAGFYYRMRKMTDYKSYLVVL